MVRTTRAGDSAAGQRIYQEPVWIWSRLLLRIQATNATVGRLLDRATGTTPEWSINVNFATTRRHPSGYLQDIGEVFGDRPMATLRMNRDITVDARYRQNASSPDLRYDTLNTDEGKHLRSQPERDLEIDIRTLLSSAHCGGDAGNFDQTVQFTLEGLAQPPSPPHRRAMGRCARALASAMAGSRQQRPLARNNKICFIDIVPGVRNWRSLARIRCLWR